MLKLQALILRLQCLLATAQLRDGVRGDGIKVCKCRCGKATQEGRPPREPFYEVQAGRRNIVCWRCKRPSEIFPTPPRNFSGLYLQAQDQRSSANALLMGSQLFRTC